MLSRDAGTIHLNTYLIYIIIMSLLRAFCVDERRKEVHASRALSCTMIWELEQNIKSGRFSDIYRISCQSQVSLPYLACTMTGRQAVIETQRPNRRPIRGSPTKVLRTQCWTLFGSTFSSIIICLHVASRWTDTRNRTIEFAVNRMGVDSRVRGC